MKALGTQLLFLAALAAGILLTACSQNPEDRLTDLARCYKAGMGLSDRALTQGVEIELAKIGVMEPGDAAGHFNTILNLKLNGELYPQGSRTLLTYENEVLTKWAATEVCKQLKQTAIDTGKN